MSFLISPRFTSRTTVFAVSCFIVALSGALFWPRASQARLGAQPAPHFAWPAPPARADRLLNSSPRYGAKEIPTKGNLTAAEAQVIPTGQTPVPHTLSDWRLSSAGEGREETFIVYRDEKGAATCRTATAEEHAEIVARNAGGVTRIIYSGAPRKRDLAQGTTNWRSGEANGLSLAPSSGLRIVLHGTTQLEQNQIAKNAFIVAANHWETIISTPITVVIDVDYGSTFFGQPYPNPNILGATGSAIVTGPFADLRQRLLNGSPTSAEQEIYNALPVAAVPVELNGVISNETSVKMTTPNARALGIIPDISDPSLLPLGQGDAGIGFNSAFQFDFDPTDGISAGLTDFDSVATHEIGHALAFISGAGANVAAPLAVMDLFRFRPAVVSLAAFASTPRIMSLGGGQVLFSNQVNTFAGLELELSTGGPNPGPNDGDRNQSSHWKDDELSPAKPYIGIMDPTLRSGLRRTISENDIIAFDLFGYSISGSAPVRPPHNDFVNAVVLQTNSGTVTGNNINATREAGEPNHAGFEGDKSVWYSWTSSVNGQITIDTIGSNFDTTLASYTGTAVYQLSLVAANDDIVTISQKESRIQFDVTAGTTYRIAVDGWNGEYGNVTLNWNATGVVPTPTPTPTPTPSPTPSPTPTPTPPCVDDTWTATTTTNAPLPRAHHTAVWTGTEMIVWGGYGANDTYLNSGARYNPSSDTWSSTSTVNAPPARAWHTAIWTGTEMIVWAGFSASGGYLNSGGRYNPVTDTWTPISSVNAPTVRYQHCAVWTGSEMIVWGGFKDIVLNTGGRYNPTTDSWTPVTTSNAPVGRLNYTATWTGNEMVVWGGQGNPSHLQSGGRYNPNTDSWTATTTLAAPSQRRDQTAVWDGREVIIWGGNPTYLIDQRNTGSRYEPSTDTWTPTTMNNVPSARAFHAAVWTGDEMFVWGGSSFNGPLLSDGGRYNPSSNTWISTCGTNAPAARIDATVVWTGREAIVWGGTQIFLLNTGGRYRIEAPPIQLLLDTSGPVVDQIAAVDSLLFLRDPFPVHNGDDLLNLGSDRNTRVVLTVTNLRLAIGEDAASVVVNLVDSTNLSQDIPAEDVRLVPDTNFTQVTFRLPDNLPAGTATIKVNAHGQLTNPGTIRIRA